MRRILLTATILLTVALLLPAVAGATTDTASHGGVTATLSYRGGPGITTHDERLRIIRDGKVVYDRPVPRTGCFRVCGPAGGGRVVSVASLYGNDGQDVVLALWTGGADCCILADIYVPSAAMHSYVLDQHNFGEGGFTLRDIGPRHRPEFISADNHFYCTFASCAASGLPLQILEFSGERFLNVTKRHPAMIRADASRWLQLYYAHVKVEGPGLIAAWAADEDNLGLSATVRTVLQRQYADRNLTLSFIRSLERFLSRHHYG